MTGRNIDISLAMLRLAEKDGIETVVATPHVCAAVARPKISTICDPLEKMRSTLKSQRPEDPYRRRAEIYFTSELISLLKDNRRPADHQQRLVFSP